MAERVKRDPGAVSDEARWRNELFALTNSRLSPSESLSKVKSTIKLPLTPNGQWQVLGLTYELNTQVPHGDWFQEMTLVPPGYVGTPPW